jgi:hypothetical protein
MKQQSKFSSQEQQQAAVEQHGIVESVKDFSTVEELLRFDAGQTSVPRTVEQRLAKSAAEITSPNRSWWKKLFGR